jgi:hypothetical protein
MRPFFVVTRYKENVEWVKNYTDQYIIYNRNEPIHAEHYYNTENVGGNQRDICHFIYNNYDNLPDIMVFVQGYAFDHCKKEIFDKLIKNKEFTPLEYYGNIPSNGWENRTSDGGFLEINNDWYIDILNNQHNQLCKYNSFDDIMNHYFENYFHLDWIRFSPGSQFLITSKDATIYPKSFWKYLMNDMISVHCTEGYIVERMMNYIFMGTYTLRKEFYE